MTEQKLITPFSSVAKFGFLAAVMLIISTYSGSVYAAKTGEELPQFVMFISFAILFMGVLFAMLDHKKKFTGQSLKYTEALGTGIMTGFVIAFLMTIFMFIFYSFDDTTRDAIQKNALAKMDENQRKIALENMKETSPLMRTIGVSLYTFVSTIFTAAVVSIIMAFFVKRK